MQRKGIEKKKHTYHLIGGEGTAAGGGSERESKRRRMTGVSIELIHTHTHTHSETETETERLCGWGERGLLWFWLESSPPPLESFKRSWGGGI